MSCFACTDAPDRLSEQLRHGTGGFIEERRAIAGLSLFSTGMMGLIGLYQLGIVKKLPLNADRVNASAEAYSHLSMPDAWLGLISYAVTGALAAAGPIDRWRTAPALPLALAGKVAADTAIAAKLTTDEWTKHKALCFWCLLSAGATVAMLPLVWKEASAAVKTLLGSP